MVFFVKVKTDNVPSCSSGSPDPELFEIRRSQTTNEEMSFRFCYLRCKRITPLSIVQDRQILNCLSSGDHKLQMAITWRGTGPRPTVRGSDLGMARDRPSPYGYRRHLLIGCDSHSRAIFQSMLRIHNHLRF